MRLAVHLQPLLVELARLERVGAASARTEVVEEQAQLDALLKKRAERRSARAATQMAGSEHTVLVRKLENDLRHLKHREKATLKALSAVTVPDERKELQHDLRSTQARVNAVRAELDETRVRLEAVQRNAQSTAADDADLDERIAATRRALEAAQGSAQQKQATERARIAEIRAELPENVLAEYDDNPSAWGAAGFQGRTCGGCFILLPPAMAANIRTAPSDTVPTCPECGTFLVR